MVDSDIVNSDLKDIDHVQFETDYIDNINEEDSCLNTLDGLKKMNINR